MAPFIYLILMPFYSIVAVFVETMRYLINKSFSRDAVMDGKGGHHPPLRTKDEKMPRLMDLFVAPPTQFQKASKDGKMPHLMDMIAPPIRFQTTEYSSDFW